MMMDHCFPVWSGNRTICCVVCLHLLQFVLCILVCLSVVGVGVVPIILVSLGVWCVHWVTNGDFLWKIVRPPSIVFASIH